MAGGRAGGAGGRSLDVLGAVGGAVVLLVSDERGQAAELDVAQPAEAGVAVLDGGDHRGFGGGGGGGRGDGDGRGRLVWKVGRPDLLPQDLRHR